MKFRLQIFSFLFLALLSTSVFGQWVAQTSGSTDRIRMIKAVNSSVLWAVGNAGKVYRSVNGGATWTIKITNAGSTNYGVEAFDSTTAWVTGTVGGSADESIWKTTDGGETWVSQFNNPNGFGDGVKFFNNNDGVFIGDPDPYPSTYWEILTTTNGGTNWIRVGRSSIPPADSVNSEAGTACALEISGNKAWFTGYPGVAGTPFSVLRSTDKGYTWALSTIPAFSGTSGSSFLAFQDTEKGVFVALEGTTAKTTDGGVTWVASNLTGAAFRGIVSIKGTSRYVAVGTAGKSWITPDGGTTWIEKATGVAQTLYTVTEYNGVAWAAGNAGTILKWSGAPLPVELTAFNSSVDDNNIMLSWTTASEKNNSGFEIERKSGSGAFTSVAFIGGKGTTTSATHYAYADNNLFAGSYTYRLKQIDFDGGYSYSKEINADVVKSFSYMLDQNYPNPFNPTTTLRYQVKEDGIVTIKMYNNIGVEVKSLVSGFQSAGTHSLQVDASNLASGIYFYTMKAPGFSATKKMIIMK
ncbi:MAG: T9SS type A sorting domain-containing protein [Ignavibacteriales bacterium]|nr:T9SS type A sorting domain-containing protein [Ignavibacteriales bacterium]